MSNVQLVTKIIVSSPNMSQNTMIDHLENHTKTRAGGATFRTITTPCTKVLSKSPTFQTMQILVLLITKRKQKVKLIITLVLKKDFGLYVLKKT